MPSRSTRRHSRRMWQPHSSRIDLGTDRGSRRRAPQMRGFVDYERVAVRYQEGRSLPAEVLERWGSAVRPYLRPGPMRVVDVGAGTGIVAVACSRWASAG